MVSNVRSNLPGCNPLIKKIGLSLSTILLSSPMIGFAAPAQALPSWLQLGSNGISNTSTQSATTSRSTNSRTTTTAQATPNSSSTQNLNDVRFSCQVSNGQYTVMYNPQSQAGQYYPWATPTSLGGGWSPERRCNEISRRLESYRPDGLVELRTGQENGYNTICVTTEDVPSCRIVLTVPPGQNPVAIRDRIFNNLLVADSGQQTSAVTAYQGNGSDIINQIGQALGLNSGGNRRTSRGAAIDLRPFLDPADGGTGARLTNTPAAQPTQPAQPNNSGGTRLNPGNFR